MQVCPEKNDVIDVISILHMGGTVQSWNPRYFRNHPETDENWH